jgi:hypothetical protein
MIVDARAAAAALAMLVVVAGCTPRSSTPLDEPVEPAVELPSYETIYAGAERRVGTLERLWAASVTSIRYVDADGERRRDQGEGHFQMRRPGSLAVFIGKLGETYLILGSDASRYWWIELLDERMAFVGDTDLARVSAVESIGVPVLPGDLLLALDLDRWPAPGSPRVLGVAWSDHPDLDRSRTVAVTFDESGRTRRVHLDAVSLDPFAVELIDEAGEVFASSRLSRHGRVLNRIGAPVEPRIPMRAEIELPAAEARLEISLSRAAMDERRPRPVVFDFEELLNRFRVGTVRRLAPPTQLGHEPSAPVIRPR